MELPQYDFWLCDLDGTLVDVEWTYVRRLFDRVGDSLGYTFDDREAHTLWNGLGGFRDEQLREWGLDAERFWSTLHAIEDPLDRAAATFIYDDAAAFLSSLDVPVGIVTHCQRYLTEPVLSELDLHGRFETVVCCTSELGWKPDPEPVRLAIEKMGVAGDDGVLVGDGPHDVGAAWNAGLDGIHLERHGHERRGRCVRGDHRLSQFPV